MVERLIFTPIQERAGMVPRIHGLILLAILVILSGCQTGDTDRSQANRLGPNAGQNAIVEHLLKAERDRTITEDLSIHYPDMTRSTAYAIQNAILKAKEMTDERIGWKVGYSRGNNANIAPDPVFGHMMASGLVESGATLVVSDCARGAPYIEAEIAFRIGKNLAGPVIKREDVVSVNPIIGQVYSITRTRDLSLSVS